MDFYDFRIQRFMNGESHAVSVNNKMLIARRIIDNKNFIETKMDLEQKREQREINKRGIYLIVFHCGEHEHALYVGRADPKDAFNCENDNCSSRKGIIDRLLDYFKDYLISSPNDFKIQHFNTYIIEKHPCITYSIYSFDYPDDTTMLTSKEQILARERLTSLERELREYFTPVFDNKGLKVNDTNMNKLINITQRIYADNFDLKFRVTSTGDDGALAVHNTSS